MLRDFYHFTRPHTVLGTTSSAVALWLIAWAHHPGATLDPKPLAVVLLSWLSANIYIVGLNQIYDIEIDRVNKPYLPLASGGFSLRTAWMLVIAAGVIALSTCLAWREPWLIAGTLSSMLIGTLYSAPPIRLKRFHVPAAMCIYSVRGVVVNLAGYLSYNAALGARPSIPPVIWVLTLFIVGYALIIAWLKDIPDVDGDRKFGIGTLSVRLGTRAVFRLGMALLLGLYTALVLLAIAGLPGVHPLTFGLTSVAFAMAALWRARAVDASDPRAVYGYYMFVWALFYGAYIAFPLSVVMARA